MNWKFHYFFNIFCLLCLIFFKLIFMISQALKKQLLDTLGSRMKDGGIKSQQITLKFLPGPAAEKAAVSTEILPVATDGNVPAWKLFSPDAYWNNLTSKAMGRVVLYTDVIPTTMTLFGG
jgi:hypothetical protein